MRTMAGRGSKQARGVGLGQRWGLSMGLGKDGHPHTGLNASHAVTGVACLVKLHMSSGTIVASDTAPLTTLQLMACCWYEID
jgi:hypothetical protein